MRGTETCETSGETVYFCVVEMDDEVSTKYVLLDNRARYPHFRK